MIPCTTAHQWVRGVCHRCGADRCTDRNLPGYRCVEILDHRPPHRYADGTTENR